VRNWKFDFTQQVHIKNAWNWMAAVGHTIKEIVSLHQCECSEQYEQWGRLPPPPCPNYEKTRPKKRALQERGPEKTGEADKRTKHEESVDKGRTVVIYHIIRRKQDRALPHTSSSTLCPPPEREYLKPALPLPFKPRSTRTNLR